MSYFNAELACHRSHLGDRIVHVISIGESPCSCSCTAQDSVGGIGNNIGQAGRFRPGGQLPRDLRPVCSTPRVFTH